MSPPNPRVPAGRRIRTVRRLLSPLRRAVGGSFLADRRGAAAVEFAIVVVPFLGFVFLIFQVALYHYSVQSLDLAVRKAGRAIMTGSVATSVTTVAAFKANHLCPSLATFVAIPCAELTVNAYRVGSVSNAADKSGIYAFIDAQTKSLKAPQSDPAKQSFCLGGPGDFIYLDVSARMAKLTWMLPATTPPLLRATTFVMRERALNASATGTC